MKILRFDSVGGASGDMVLGTLLDLGVPLETLQNAVDALVPGEVKVTAEKGASRGISGILASVKLVHARHDAHEHAHRGLTEITDLIERSGLAEPVRRLALAVFRRLAEAEGKVHGIAPEKVHFHEVGALDAIADVVASCAGLDGLGVDGVVVGPLPVGCGTTSSAHGVLPLPVPAVVELLSGMAVTRTDEPHELVTPTGAALLSTWAREMPVDAGNASATVLGSGYGLGHRQLERRANVLRGMLIEGVEAGGDAPSCCLKLECNLDDLTPEVTGALFQKLMESGALDVFTTAVQMKKQRPGVLFTVLCRLGDRERMLDILFRDGTSFGVRESVVDRTVLDRRMETVQTPFGPIRMKCGIWKGQVVTRAPEYEDCAAAARKHGVPVRQVLEAAGRA